MIKLDFKWKKKTGQYQSGESLYINRVKVGGYEWNGARPKADTDKAYVGYVYLPSLIEKSKTTYDFDINKLKGRIERIVTAWFEEITKEGEKHD